MGSVIQLLEVVFATRVGLETSATATQISPAVAVVPALAAIVYVFQNFRELGVRCVTIREWAHFVSMTDTSVLVKKMCTASL